MTQKVELSLCTQSSSAILALYRVRGTSRTIVSEPVRSLTLIAFMIPVTLELENVGNGDDRAAILAAHLGIKFDRTDKNRENIIQGSQADASRASGLSDDGELL